LLLAPSSLSVPPAATSINLGDTATLGCNIQNNEGNSVRWMKHVPGIPPQYILRFLHSWNTPKYYGTKFSSSRFTSKAQNKNDYQLIISNVEASDTAVYYCYNWDSSGSAGVSQ
uniref:Ig-like domain-containing protein n=1 Tax=Erpetoichthys calabaricus TaxID=27687 RepID=A0A8C4SGG9_ERPCA